MLAPSHVEMDITNYRAVLKLAKLYRPRVVIHSAALVGRAECQANKKQAVQVNICGTRNILLACKETKAKLVYISTAAVFDGKKGNYFEDDKPNPQYFYAETKLVAEAIVVELDDHLIIRTDFFDPAQFKYQDVYSDHYCSKEPTRIIAKKIVKAIDVGATGVKHIGGPRRILYDILRPFFPSISPITIRKSSMPDFPRDLSLASR
jgi:dTDP-4-dehydrorhamnose reductase